MTEQMTGAAIQAHRHFGPGLLESVCEASRARERSMPGMPFESPRQVLVAYKGVQLASDLGADFLVDGKVVVGSCFDSTRAPRANPDLHASDALRSWTADQL
jgi:GxxExxY protein